VKAGQTDVEAAVYRNKQRLTRLDPGGTLFSMVFACTSGASIPGEFHLQRENFAYCGCAESQVCLHLRGARSTAQKGGSGDAMNGVGQRPVPEVKIKAE